MNSFCQQRVARPEFSVLFTTIWASRFWKETLQMHINIINVELYVHFTNFYSISTFDNFPCMVPESPNRQCLKLFQSVNIFRQSSILEHLKLDSYPSKMDKLHL